MGYLYYFLSQTPSTEITVEKGPLKFKSQRGLLWMCFLDSTGSLWSELSTEWLWLLLHTRPVQDQAFHNNPPHLSSYWQLLTEGGKRVSVFFKDMIPNNASSALVDDTMQMYIVSRSPSRSWERKVMEGIWEESWGKKWVVYLIKTHIFMYEILNKF